MGPTLLKTIHGPALEPTQPLSYESRSQTCLGAHLAPVGQLKRLLWDPPFYRLLTDLLGPTQPYPTWTDSCSVACRGDATYTILELRLGMCGGAPSRPHTSSQVGVQPQR
jgi:hypothetical protein